MTRSLERRFDACPEELKQIREAVREATRGSGLDEETTGDVVLAVDEACQNIIRHAYGGCEGGEIELVLRVEDGSVVVELRDFASAVDPECVKGERDLEEVRPGGLGTHFMRTLMDEVEFVECSDRGNLLRMRKRLADRA